MKKTGYIKDWNAKGFGFVRNYPNDIFVHVSSLPRGMEVVDGTFIEYDTLITEKGEKAINIVDKTEEKALEVKKVKEEEQVLIKRSEVHLEKLKEKYSGQLDEIKNDLDENNIDSIIKYIDAINNLDEKLMNIWDTFSVYYDWYDVTFIPDTEYLEDLIRSCSVCDDRFLKEEINNNWSSYRLYACDGCAKEAIKEREIKLDIFKDKINSIDLSSISTKKELKSLVREILLVYNSQFVSSFDTKSQLVIASLLSEGDYNVGYFMPKGGSNRRGGDQFARLQEWRSTGKFLVSDVSWRSKKGNWCNDTQKFKAMGSIDESFNNIMELIKDGENG